MKVTTEVRKFLARSPKWDESTSGLKQVAVPKERRGEAIAEGRRAARRGWGSAGGAPAPGPSMTEVDQLPRRPGAASHTWLVPKPNWLLLKSHN